MPGSLCIRFIPETPLCTSLVAEYSGTTYVLPGSLLLKWWHEIAVEYYETEATAQSSAIQSRLYPLLQYLVLGEPGDISTFDGEDTSIHIGTQGNFQKIWLLNNLFTDCTNTKDKAAYAKCSLLIGDDVKRAPSYHEFALYFLRRLAKESGKDIAWHLLGVINGTVAPKDIMEALFVGASIGSELLRNRTSFIDTLLNLKLVHRGALELEQLIIGGAKSEREKISETFPVPPNWFPNLEAQLKGAYAKNADAIRAAWYIHQLNLRPGKVAIETTESHSSSSSTVEANCWIDLTEIAKAFQSNRVHNQEIVFVPELGRWKQLGALTCNPSQLGGALPMTGHNTQSLGSNALAVKVCQGTVGYTQVQAKTITSIIRWLYYECEEFGPSLYFAGAFSKAVSQSTTIEKALKTFIRKQMIRIVFERDADVPEIDAEDLDDHYIQEHLETVSSKLA